jgi:hypothetical protein
MDQAVFLERASRNPFFGLDSVGGLACNIDRLRLTANQIWAQLGLRISGCDKLF